jgi:RsiW-degrading membrane proteinase PrsW (M82 family)
VGILWLGVLAVGPGLCLTHVVWARDREREPVGNLLLYLLLGGLAVLPAVLLEIPLAALLQPEGDGLRFLLLPTWALFGVALAEEGSKLLLLRARGRGDRHIDQPFDWVVYAVAVALGFATVENLVYVLQLGPGVGVLRAFTAVPAHALDGTMMGWRLARAARLTGADAQRQRRLALWEPALWHAAYDLPLFALRELPRGGLMLLLVLVWLAVLVAQWRICVARMRTMIREQHLPAPPLLALDELARRLRHRPRAW